MYNHLVDNMELNHERILCKACVIDKENIDDQISFKIKAPNKFGGFVYGPLL